MSRKFERAEARTPIPRTFKQAMTLGAVAAKITYDDLSPALRAQFMKLSNLGSRLGSLCGLGPSETPGMILVCYKDQHGQCHWVEWPKGEWPPTHG